MTIHRLAPGHVVAETQGGSAGGGQPSETNVRTHTHGGLVSGPTSHNAPVPKLTPKPQSGIGAGAPDLPAATVRPQTQGGDAAGGQFPPEAMELASTQHIPASGAPNSSAQRLSDTQRNSGTGSTPAPDHDRAETHGSPVRGGFLREPILSILADVVTDFETVRVANENRVRQLTRTETDKDGGSRGFGLAGHPEVVKLQAAVAALAAAEHDAVLNLQRAVRKHPLGHVQKRYRGLGEKQFARLLAAIGDPFWNDLHERPRTVSELWAYSGFHVLPASGHGESGPHSQGAAAGFNTIPGVNDEARRQSGVAPGVAPKRQRGQRSNWNEEARKRCFVISESFLRNCRKAEDKRGPQDPIADKYRVLYDAAKAKHADAAHAVECVRCGPSGKPAPAGSPLSKAHIHARALRAVSKELLKELWIEARAKYVAAGQPSADTQHLPACGCLNLPGQSGIGTRLERAGDPTSSAQLNPETHPSSGAGPRSPGSHGLGDTQTGVAAGAPTSASNHVPSTHEAGDAEPSTEGAA